MVNRFFHSRVCVCEIRRDFKLELRLEKPVTRNEEQKYLLRGSSSNYKRNETESQSCKSSDATTTHQA